MHFEAAPLTKGSMGQNAKQRYDAKKGYFVSYFTYFTKYYEV